MSQPPAVTAVNLEQNLSERINFIFHQQLGHKVDEIQCNLLEHKLVIVVKQALTKPELLLLNNGHEAIAKDIRNSIEEILQPQIKSLIEEIIETQVSELLFATHLDADCLSIIALLLDNKS